MRQHLEYDLSMSRREIAVNVALGSILLLLFAVPLIFLILTGGLLFRALDPLVGRYFSGLPQGLWELLLFSVFLLWRWFRPAESKEG